MNVGMKLSYFLSISSKFFLTRVIVAPAIPKFLGQQANATSMLVQLTLLLRTSLPMSTIKGTPPSSSLVGKAISFSKSLNSNPQTVSLEQRQTKAQFSKFHLDCLSSIVGVFCNVIPLSVEISFTAIYLEASSMAFLDQFPFTMNEADL